MALTSHQVLAGALILGSAILAAPALLTRATLPAIDRLEPRYAAPPIPPVLTRPESGSLVEINPFILRQGVTNRVKGLPLPPPPPIDLPLPPILPLAQEQP